MLVLTLRYIAFQNNASSSSATTTVFVGNITERASDAFIRQLLMVCI